ncbi:MAG: hypothetical protein KKG59_06350 [Nanoarchaeota archaeon]|nr:hypothetical protein [Nanoarchaeota archaeon]
MSFEQCIKERRARKVMPNKARAASLMESSNQAIATAKTIKLQQSSLKSIFRELYEGLREYCEAIGYLQGYKFMDHESYTHFLRDELREDSIAKKFDRYRKLRNGINYYGDDVDVETVKEALINIPKMINDLKKPKNI